MFFHPDILQRRTGCFATIWLAATKGRKLTMKEMLKVNVEQTCEEIIRYISGQVPAPQPDQPQPRFSLYLSSQLQYGVVLVYHRHCAFMLEEAHKIIRNLSRMRTQQNDFAGPDRLVLDVDDMFLMEQAEGAQNPFFGLMNEPRLPSPSQIPQMFQREEGPSPLPSLHTSPAAAITMKDQPPLVVNTAEICGGVELTEPTEEELQMLMAMSENFFEDMAEQERLNTLNNAQLEAEICSANQRSPASSLQNPPEDPPQVEVRPKKRRAGGQRRKKRVLVDIDTVMQIPYAVMKKQIDNPRTETHSLPEMVCLTSVMKLKSAPESLFSASCTLMVDGGMMKVWEESAKHVGHKEREQLKAKRRMERKRGYSQTSSQTSTGSDESSPHPAEPSCAVDLQSHSDGNTPATWSPRGAQSQDLTAHRLLRLVSSHHRRGRRITFDTLLPPVASRLTAARTMFKVLELVQAKKLVVLQTEAFSSMEITPAN